MTPQTDNRPDFVVIPSNIRHGAAPERPRPGTPAILLIAAGVIVPVALALSAAFANELQILGVVLAVIGLLVILARPFYGLLLFVTLLYTRPEESIPALADMHFTLAVALITFVGMWFHQYLSKQGWMRSPLYLMMLGFGAAAVISSISNGNVSDAIQDIGRLIMLLVLIVNLVRTPEQYRIFVTAVILCTGYLAFNSIHLFFGGKALLENGTLARAEATGIFDDPNDLASAIVTGVALALSQVAHSSKLSRVFHLLIAAVLVYAIYLTSSRGGMLSLLIVLFGFFYGAVRNKKIAIVLGVMAAVVAFSAGSGHMTNFDSSEASANSRFWFWDAGYRQLIMHPLLGVGYDAFESVNGGMTAHNSFVLCYAELGVIGYFFWLGLLYYCLKPTDRLRGEARPSPQNPDLYGARLALVAYLVASFFLSHTYTPILFVIVGLTCSAVQVYAPPGEVTVADRRRFLQRDWLRIGAITIISIAVIEMIALRYM